MTQNKILWPDAAKINVKRKYIQLFFHIQPNQDMIYPSYI